MKKILVLGLVICFVLALQSFAWAANDLLGGLLGTVTETAGGVVGTAVETAVSVPAQVLQSTPLNVDLAGNTSSSLTGDVVKLVPETLNAVTGLAGGTLNTATGLAKDTLGAATGLAGATLNTATGVVGQTLNTATGLVGKTLDTTAGLVGKTLDTAAGLVGGLLGAGTGGGQFQLPAALPQAGSDVLPFQLAGLVLAGLGLTLRKFF
ncbi:MAG: hypothetical protein QHH75_13680 [Bacillota bacterium]|nr:hypothetical protein [Bacillota bacterium]